MPSFPDDSRLRVAVITGRHPFDVPGLYNAFRSLPEVDSYPQSLEEFGADAGQVRAAYDVLVFYHFHQEIPEGEGAWWERGCRDAIEQLGQTGQGIFVLHHGLVAWRDWPLWENLVGIPDRGQGFEMNQEIRVQIADPDHPVTRGLAPWTMTDEIYSINDAAMGSHILLTTDHPRSMKTLAWTRHHRNARVFCLQLGHDNQAFSHPMFRTLLDRGIHWVAGRLA